MRHGRVLTESGCRVHGVIVMHSSQYEWNVMVRYIRIMRKKYIHYERNISIMRCIYIRERYISVDQ